ncbi:MAG: hypothetical protein ACLQPD_03390, partial [Desulfomonilaceae bacterium]
TTTDVPPVTAVALGAYHIYPPNNPGTTPFTCNDQSLIASIDAAGLITARSAAFVDCGAQH